MSDLSHCINLHKTSFPKEEMRSLRLESRKLAMEKKIKFKEAMIQVVRSRIAETQAEYNKIEAVIEKHYKVPVGKAVPEEKILPISGAFGSTKRAAKETGELAKVARNIKEERQIKGVKALTELSEKDLEKMAVDDLDSLLADVTMGPGNFVKTGNWKKEHFVEALMKEKAKIEKKAIVIDEESYLAQKAAGRQVMGEAALHKNIEPGIAKERAIERQTEKDRALIERRDELRKEYKAKTKNGEIRKPTRTEALIETAKGHEDLEQTQAARRLLKKRGIPEKAVPEKKARRTPAVKKVVGQRSTKEDDEFYHPFNVKKSSKIIEGKQSSSVFKGKTQAYADGFFTQGHYAIKLPEAPKTNKPLLTGDGAPDIKAIFPTEGLLKARLIGELKIAKTEITIAHAVDSKGNDHFFDAKYVDVILTKYPDAIIETGPALRGGVPAVFKVDGEPVGLVMSLNTAALEGIKKLDPLEEIHKIKERAINVKFSVAKKERGDLVAYHNLSSEDLIASDDLGGMPMPSLAITKKDFPYEPFGDITMVGSEGMVDLEGTFNRVFDSDTYSPTVPWKERDLIRKAYDELWNRLSDKIGDAGDYIYSLTENAEKGYDSLLNYFDNSNGTKVAFLREQGIPIRIPMRVIGYRMPFSDTEAVQNFVKNFKGKISDIKLHSPEHKAVSDAIRRGIDEAIERDHPDAPDVRKDVIDTWFDEEGYAAWGLTMQRLEQDAKLILKTKKEIDKSALRESLEKKFTKKVTAKYLEWTKKQIDPLYGDPYLKLGRKKVPYTLSNVFEAMHRQNIKASQALPTFGPAEARAMGSKEFPTLDAARKHKTALMHHDDFQKLKEEQSKERESLTDALGKHYKYKDWRGEVDWWESINDSMKAIGIFLKNPVSKQTPSFMKSCLSRRGFQNVNGNLVKKTAEFAKTLRTMPTEYFEVKPERIVNIDEFSGAVLPKNVDPRVKAILKKHGVPFKIYKTEAERQAVTASFQRKKGVLFSEEPANGLAMYSALTKAAKSPKFPAKLSAKSVINQLKKAPGVKQTEIDTVGLSEWLEGKEKVSRAELVKFLKLNEVRVEEIEKGKELSYKRLGWRKRGYTYTPSPEFEFKIGEIEFLPSNKKYIYKDLGGTQDVYDTLAEAKDAALRVAKNIGIGTGDTKYAKYVLPGGEPGSYRELVLRIPVQREVGYIPPLGKWVQAQPWFATWVSHGENQAEAQRLYDQWVEREIRGRDKTSYISAHWDEPNVIAHIRGDTRIDANGKRRFHIAEFQSDIYSRIAELEQERATKIITATDKFDYSGKELANLKKLFPWGENWHELVAKKALEYAIRNDFDGISWDTAKTQVDRWESALRQSVDRINWTKAPDDQVWISTEKNKESAFSGMVSLQGEIKIEGQRVTLNNLIGKDLANKIRESSENTGKFEGDNLTLGGEFYKIIYDQKIPGFLKKYGKKWGAKVGMSKINDIPIHTIGITPTMREAIQSKGQALFAKAKKKTEEKLTVDTARAEIATRIGEKAVNALERTEKIKLLTMDEAVKLTGRQDLRKSGAQGFYYGGTVYLLPGGIDKGKAWNVLMHELGVHYGFIKIFGKKLAKEVFNAFTLKRYNDDKLGKAIARAFNRIPESTPFDFRSEEAVAYFAEENANIDLPLHRKIIARMRLWAVKYFGVKPDIFTHDDYVALAASAMRGAVKEAERAPVRAGKSEEVFYSVAEKKDLQSWADDLIKSAKKKGVVMDKKTPSPKRLRETSISTLAGLDIKKLDQSAKSFLQGMSPKGKGYGAAIEKWLASPEWYQHPVLKKIVKRALDKSERFHTLFNEFNAVDDPMAEHDTVAKTLEVLARKGGISKAAFILGRTSADFKKLETLLDDADVYGEKHTVEELKEKGYSKDVIQAWSVVRESYDKQLEALIKPMKDLVARIKEQAAFMGTEPVYPDFGDFIVDGKKRRLTLKEAVMEMGRYKGTYSPRIRNRGEWVVKGKKEGVVSEGGDSYFRDNRKTKSFANLLRDKLVKEGYTDVKVEKESRLPEETFQAVRMAEMGTMIGHAASKGLDKYDSEMQMAFMDEVITASADLIKSRGARSTMIKRREGLAVRGYITNPLIRFVRYTGTNAAGIAKGEMAQRMIKDLYGEYVNGKKVGGIDAAKEGEIHSLARAYIEEQLRNAETGDRIIGVMKALTTFKFLGFNPRSVLVNITALTTSVPMALHTYAMDGKGSMLRIGKVLSKSCKDYTRVMAGKRLTDVDEQTFIDDFRAAGYTDAQYTRDAMGNVQGAYGTAWSKLMGGSMYVFGKSEEWVRGGTALAAYRLCRKQGLSHIDANKKAIEATAKAHGTYGKETLPMVAWGKGVGRLGQAFYTYMKFPHNYLQMLYDAGVRKKNVKGVIFGIAAPAVLGGIAATPMYATAMALANALMSLVDDDRDAEKFVYDTLNEYIGKTGEETIRGGALGFLDLDISGSLAMGPGAIPTSLYDLTGAVGGMVNDIYKGAGYAVVGEYGRAAEKILPKFTGTVFTAIREMREGATTSKGDRVWDEEGRPYIPKTSETVKRGFGFRSARRALLAQSTWVSKREEQRFKKTASDIYKKIKYLTAGAENVIINQDIRDKISNYNQNALKTSNISLITPASVERQLERMKTPTTKQKARVTKYERAATFEGDIWAGALGVTDEMDKTQSEIKKLSDAGILKYSAPPSRNINAGYGIKVKLDDDQYSRYVADTSAMVKTACDRLIFSPRWQKWNDKQKAIVVKRVINEGRKIVRDRLKITILRSRMKGRK